MATNELKNKQGNLYTDKDISDILIAQRGVAITLKYIASKLTKADSKLLTAFRAQNQMDAVSAATQMHEATVMLLNLLGNDDAINDLEKLANVIVDK